MRQGYGVGGSMAGCFSVKPGGRLSLHCIKCEVGLLCKLNSVGP